MITRLIHRLIFKELVFLFLLIFFSLISLVMVDRLLRFREILLNLRVTFIDILQLFFYFSLPMLLLLLPVVALLCVFLTFLRMNTDREIVALKSGGVSLAQLLPAPVAFCLILATINLFISFEGLAWGMSHFRAKLFQLVKTRTELVIRPGVFNKDFPGLTIYVQSTGEDGTLRRIMVKDETRKDLAATIIAQTGFIRSDPENNSLYFVLLDGRMYQQDNGETSIVSFEQYSLKLDLSRIMADTADPGEIKPAEISWRELHQLENAPDTADKHGLKFLQKIRIEIQKRLIFPSACFILGIMSIPLAGFFQGLHRQYGILLALGLFLLYYFFFSLGLALAESGTLHPSVALWTPNILFGFLAVYGFRLAVRERTPRFMSRLRHWRERKT